MSFLDGAFGFNGKEIENPDQGALAGLVKTAALEWPTVLCHAIDIDPVWCKLSPNEAARSIVNEILKETVGQPVEIGLNSTGSFHLQLYSEPVSEKKPLNLNRQDVVIVTGGARGVTAFAAKDSRPGDKMPIGIIGTFIRASARA